ncbi:MAG: hypothetical protein FJ319_08695 [SAR202 cluster bacterium]|nr:hypothetical protein [SAR202 cluster bacterium]
MHFSQFDHATVPAGTKQTMYLDIAPLSGGEMLRLAVLVARGAKPGPTIAITGGVHGDEYEGPHAVREVFASLDPAEMSGTFMGISQTNVPAFTAGTRNSGIDGGNLARVFPGKPNGNVTERIAYHVGSRFIGRSDFYIDLHSSGSHIAMPTLIGYCATPDDRGRRSKEAALAFGVPVIWGHPAVAPGRTISFADERGIPWLYSECPGGGWLHQEIAATYAQGVRNVMMVLGILPGKPTVTPPKYRLIGDGNIDVAPSVSAGGYLVPEVDILQRVKKGDVLGRVVGLGGELLEELRTTVSGVVVLVRRTPSVQPGEQAFLVTQEEN